MIVEKPMTIEVYHTRNGTTKKFRYDSCGNRVESGPEARFSLREAVTEATLKTDANNTGSGFFEIQWPLGYFYLSTDLDKKELKEKLVEYINHGRIIQEIEANHLYPERPDDMYPDDGVWLERYLRERAVPCSIVKTYVKRADGFEPSIE
jgi:hypothetical protein